MFTGDPVIYYSDTTAFSFTLNCPSNLTQPTSASHNRPRIRVIAQERLQIAVFVIRKVVVYLFLKY